MKMSLLIGQCLYNVVSDILSSTPECSWGHGLLWGWSNLSTPRSETMTKMRTFRGSAKEARKPRKTGGLEENKKSILLAKMKLRVLGSFSLGT